jgi:hypothetical protein
MRSVDAERLKILDGSFAKKVLADVGYHRDIGSAVASGNGLVGALAAKAKIKTCSKNRFSRPRKGVAKGDHVRVGASDHDNPG